MLAAWHLYQLAMFFLFVQIKLIALMRGYLGYVPQIKVVLLYRGEKKADGEGNKNEQRKRKKKEKGKEGVEKKEGK